MNGVSRPCKYRIFVNCDDVNCDMPKLWANATCFVDPVAVGQIVLPPSTVVATSQSFLGVHSFGSSAHSAAIVTDALKSRASTVRHCLKGYTYHWVT